MISLLKNPLARQFAVVIIVNLSVLAIGMGLAWPSPVLVMLRESEDPVLSRPVTDNEGSWIVAISPLVGMAANAFPAFLLDRIGRKPCILLASAPNVAAGFVFYFATEPWMLLLGRAFIGVAIAFIFSVIPTYASEIASTQIRGALGTMLQIMSSIGILIMLSIGPFTTYHTLNIIYTAVIMVAFVPLLFLPESPYFLYTKGRTPEAVEVLTFLRGTEALAHEELKEYALNKNSGDNTLSTLQMFSNRMFLKTFAIVAVLVAGAQLVGFNAVTFYLQTVLESTQTSVRPEIASVVIGVIQLTASVCTTLITDRFGRKPILCVTLGGMMLGMVGLGAFFKATDGTEDIVGFLNFLPIISLILVVFSFSAGVGSVNWALSAELFDGPTRARGLVFVTSLSMLFTFLTTKYFPVLTSTIGPAITYWIFSLNCVLLGLFVFFCVPETKGKSFAEIQAALGAKSIDDDCEKPEPK